MYICSTGETANTYSEYLKTNHWRKVRISRLNLTRKNGEKRHSCECCGKSKQRFHTHHVTYERVGNELLDDVVHLCVICHREIHKLLDEEISNGADEKEALKTIHLKYKELNNW